MRPDREWPARAPAWPLAVLAAAIGLAGCTITYSPEFHVPPLTGGSPLTTLPPTHFDVVAAQDSAPRRFKTHVARAFELPQSPAVLIAEETAAELRRSGHTAQLAEHPGQDRTIIVVSVKQFVVKDLPPTFYTMRIVEEADVAFSVYDGEQPSPIFQQEYKIAGRPREARTFRNEAFAEDVARMLEVAAQQVVLEFTTDPDFIASLQSAQRERSSPMLRPARQ